jgi:hypothetical protein
MPIKINIKVFKPVAIQVISGIYRLNRSQWVTLLMDT